MSIICAAIKKNECAISGDTQSNFGSMTVSAEHIKNHSKLFRVNDSVIGLVGWNAISNMFEHMINSDGALFKLDSSLEIYSTLVRLHEKMKHNYFIETHENKDQPVESNQLDAIIANKHGIFEIGSYREVVEYKTFCAIGSGRRYALGAMHAVYDSQLSAKEIVEAGVNSAAEFNDACGLPLESEVIKLM